MRLALVFVILSTTLSFGQSLKGSRYVQGGIGFRDVGLNGFLYGGQTISQLIKLEYGGGIGFGKVADINYKYVFADVISSLTLREVRRAMSVNGVGGISLNTDIINGFESVSYDKKVSLNYGMLAGLSGEFYVDRNVTFVLSAQGRYYFRNEFGNWRYQVGAAVRFTF
ncbi:MAG TPA: hypothetical protein PKJ63_02480 [Cyclobacteriaceae bacterium]|nr:hypothetical protein [Cyclobacteriaceae bacterium]